LDSETTNAHNRNIQKLQEFPGHPTTEYFALGSL
jgi:hypothetical protein